MLPDPLKALLTTIILALVIEGLKALSTALGRDLSKNATVIASVITAIILFSFDAIVKVLPPDAQSAVSAFLQFLVLLLGAGGVWRTATRIGSAKVPQLRP